jgi:hypothetical protein
LLPIDPAPALEPAPDCAKAVPAKPSARTDVVNNKRFITIQPPWSAALLSALSTWANAGRFDPFRPSRES